MTIDHQWRSYQKNEVDNPTINCLLFCSWVSPQSEFARRLKGQPANQANHLYRLTSGALFAYYCSALVETRPLVAPPPASLSEEGNEQMENLFQDLRYCIRTFLNRPGFASIIVVTLGFGNRRKHRDLLRCSFDFDPPASLQGSGPPRDDMGEQFVEGG